MRSKDPRDMVGRACDACGYGTFGPVKSDKEFVACDECGLIVPRLASKRRGGKKNKSVDVSLSAAKGKYDWSDPGVIEAVKDSLKKIVFNDTDYGYGLAKLTIVASLKCERHPRYKAERKPRVPCPDCVIKFAARELSRGR